MSDSPVETLRLKLVPKTIEQVLAMLESMDAAAKAEVSVDWLARLHGSPPPDTWTLGFTLAHRTDEVVVGQAGFKGPPDPDGVVEIAYGVEPEHQGRGYATEAAQALAAYAFASGLVRTVRAHTLPESNASTRVLTKCGFRKVGEVIDHEDGLVWRWEKSAPS